MRKVVPSLCFVFSQVIDTRTLYIHIMQIHLYTKLHSSHWELEILLWLGGVVLIAKWLDCIVPLLFISKQIELGWNKLKDFQESSFFEC